MRSKQAFAKLEELDRKLNMMSHILSVLGWDFETSMSPRGGAERGRQCAWLGEQIHNLIACDSTADLIEQVKQDIQTTPAWYSDRDRALVRILDKACTKERCVPSSLVTEMAIATNEASDRWFEARGNCDFASFSPYLEKVFNLTIQRARCIRPDSPVYDTLLDEFEPGLTAQRTESLFSDMEKTIRKVMEMTSGQDTDDSFLYLKYPRRTQERLDKSIVLAMGFDTRRGVMGISHHPFTTTVGEDDIRITSRFTDPRVADPLFSYIHEGGHALYEMGASNALTRGTSLAGGTSMAFHESQSRLWENVFGHSRPFWEFWYPRFEKAYPRQLEGIGLDRFVRAINKVQASDIRVNADEVTYGLHIILRFRLEKALFDGSLAIADLPGAWDELSMQLLGRRPESIASGVLQDNHWAGGAFGYFPSYALGNLINSQILYTMKSRLDIDALLREGRLKTLRTWLDRNIYRYGAIYESPDLLEKVTGQVLTASFFDRYLTEKYTALCQGN